MITQQGVIIELNPVRDGAFVFYNRRENGNKVHTAERISLDHAQEIYETNNEAAVDWQRQTGHIDFGTEPCVWSWTARVVLE
jgi:hypothetical protein